MRTALQPHRPRPRAQAQEREGARSFPHAIRQQQPARQFGALESGYLRAHPPHKSRHIREVLKAARASYNQSCESLPLGSSQGASSPGGCPRASGRHRRYRCPPTSSSTPQSDRACRARSLTHPFNANTGKPHASLLGSGRAKASPDGQTLTRAAIVPDTLRSGTQRQAINKHQRFTGNSVLPYLLTPRLPSSVPTGVGRRQPL